MERTIWAASTPLKTQKSPKQRVCERGGRAAAQRQRTPQDGSPAQHLLAVGNPVWTSAQREGYAACLPLRFPVVPPPTRSSSDGLVSGAGRDAAVPAVSDMKGALGLVGVLLSFLLGELCGPPPPALSRSCECLQRCRTCWGEAARAAAVVVRVLFSFWEGRVDFLAERFVSRRLRVGV